MLLMMFRLFIKNKMWKAELSAITFSMISGLYQRRSIVPLNISEFAQYVKLFT